MDDNLDSDVSPMGHTPPSLPTGRSVDGLSEPLKDSSHARSPLRVSLGVNDVDSSSRTIHSVANGPSVSSKPSSTKEPDEFPFDASSTPAPPPTNDMFKSQQPADTPLPLSAVNGPAHPHGPSAPVSRKPTMEGEESDAGPKGRRSVQFARSATYDPVPNSHSRNQSVENDEGDAKGKEKGQGLSLMTKLKALAAPISLQGHSRSHSAFAGGTPPHGIPHDQLSPASERGEFRFDGHDSEADADAEESAGEGPSGAPRRKRKSRRWFDDGTQTAPTTPKHAKDGHFFSKDSPGLTPTSSTAYRPTFLRRGTMSDIPENQRGGVSEDEGRDRLAKDRWVRGLHSARGMSYGGLRRREPGAEESEERRPSHLRRLTGFGGNADGQPSPWKIRSERTSSLGAQKWRSLKSTLKMLGKGRAERQVDHIKSAELMAELLAGAPAALFVASMFQRDERGHRRIPVLLEQLKCSITDSYTAGGEKDKAGERHTWFRIELEYGSGLTRMKWVVHRSIRDFGKLHVNYKLLHQQERLSFGGASKNVKRKNSHVDRNKEKESIAEDANSAPYKKTKLPAFPVSAVPYLRGLRALGLSDDEDEKEAEDEEAAGNASGQDAEASGTDRPSKATRKKSSFYMGRRKLSIGSPDPGNGPATPFGGRQTSFAGGAGQVKRETPVERQRRKLETYLNQMISFFIFRPDSNRLCKFLELSALGVRLAAEGGYHGKEGHMIIQSSKGVDQRKKWAPRPLVQRHSPKWFLVRHSYIVCVDGPEDMNVYDVFIVDSDFAVEARGARQPKKNTKQQAKDLAEEAKATATGHHQLKLYNAERKMKLLVKNERMLNQFLSSIRFMASQTSWAQKQRFDSFAPVRKKVYAQWLVDGRDYMWNVSRAISMARDVIYIHDWWLSPELYMRRPPAISQKWRLDRLLQRKAQEGVKVFVIMYRNINTAIPIDSEYSKFSLLDLHPNVFVQRSPNQIRQNTFFWAHHEKICIVDHTIAFCGGVDLCFGRWDTPQHGLVDDKPTGFELDDSPKDADHCQLWPGKDYSNPRVQDFYSLDKPYEEMYDRSKVPRMPWHDIGMQIVGQPARDLTRHFVQRWNYLLRQRKPSRPTPFLLPPPDFNPADLEALGLDGTCEVQILRSACSWSLGTPNKTEHSIMNAYVQMISTSQHFVYIENQFYISTCEVLGTKIENRISDALVDRIKRAHKNQEDWRACIIIPLMPGFQNSVDQQEGSSLRLIMTCQYRSICRGESSIFGRLRAAGIEPEDYIQFYALRSWGVLGPNKALVTEQLYIHAKCMIVDDRVAIIGSANINERSMLGSRDSEVAAIVRDTEMLDSYMAGEPYKVGKFPHTLRMRLMREHLGVDVDHIMEEEWQSHMSDDASSHFHTDSSTPSSPEREMEQKLAENQARLQDELIARAERLHSFNHDIDWEQANNPHLVANKKPATDRRVIGNAAHRKDVRGEGPDHLQAFEHSRPELSRGRDSYVDDHGHEVLASDVAIEGPNNTTKKSPPPTRNRSNTVTTRTSAQSSSKEGNIALPPSRIPRMDTQQLGLTHLSQLPALPVSDDTDIGGPPLSRTFSAASSHIIQTLLADMRRPVVTEDCMKDPLIDAFYLDTWHTVAENNTKLFRHVFRCQPDNEVKTWKQYKEYAAFAERFNQAQGQGKSPLRKMQESPGKTGPPGTGAVPVSLAAVAVQAAKPAEAFYGKLAENAGTDNGKHPPQGKVEDWAQEQERHVAQATKPAAGDDVLGDKVTLQSTPPSNDAIVSPIGEKAPTETFVFPPPPPVPDTVSDLPDYFSTTAAANNANLSRNRTVTISEPTREASTRTANGNLNMNSVASAGSRKGRRRGTTKSSTRAFHAQDNDILLDKEDAKRLLELVQGHLVVWPYDWLEKEESGGGWLYTVDQIAPLEIYT
ncbi:phospholipase D [Westerdykella ornata]|uniref:Phospholipase D1 n=1 Tax=Westerdykella ornata TaxID=318751 RepID=A0A6A6JRH7_WESOR|nr:phospholipase D [Westerdykella ornata]KAF2278997.1 phospholipase D [Westerdykella ornata]